MYFLYMNERPLGSEMVQDLRTHSFAVMDFICCDLDKVAQKIPFCVKVCKVII